MNNELISIIVPIYNCEQYLVECIDSIIRQTYVNLEIILVDDGSMDSSGKICDEYAQKDKRIRVIHKENGGQQSARAVGIAMAKGTFIGFVDSDDWIDADMYENLYKSIGLSDWVTSGFWWYDISGTRTKIVDNLETGIYNGQSEYFCENLIVFAGNTGSRLTGGLVDCVWNKLYRTSIVKALSQSVDINIKNEEDTLFTILYALKCKELVITHECYYHYRYNPSSVTHKKNMDYLSDMNKFYKVLDRAIIGHAFEKKLRNQVNRLLLYFIYKYTSSAMQMGMELNYPQYVFPENRLLNGKKVVLFGCGKVGKSYYRNWRDNGFIHVVQWVDNAPPMDEILGQKIYNVEEIVQSGYDYVVCAVLEQEKAEGMKKQLVEYGVEADAILWKNPDDIFRRFFLQDDGINMSI